MGLKAFIGRNIKTVFNKVYYSGSARHCNSCGRNFRKFQMIGEDFPVLREKQVVGGGLREAGCPFCNSTDRERLIRLYLSDYYKAGSRGKIKVLHIAPEKGLIRFFQSIPEISYIGGDLFTEGYTYPDFVVNMDITAIPYEDNSFDLVICNHVLEHVPDDLKAMKEIYRVLKPDGQAILQVPFSLVLDKTLEDPGITDPKKREELYGQFDHVRLYGQDYPVKLGTAGFKVEMINLSRLDPENERYGINKKEDLFIAKK